MTDAVNVFVLQTPISRPQRVYTTPSATRVAWLPTTLQMVIWGDPLPRASSIAARVSTVSPDWPTETTRVSGPSMAPR